MTVSELIAAAQIGRDLVDAKGQTYHHSSVVVTLANGEQLCCFFASKAPNSRGACRGRHDRVGFTYRGKEISKARAAEMLT